MRIESIEEFLARGGSIKQVCQGSADKKIKRMKKKQFRK